METGSFGGEEGEHIQMTRRHAGLATKLTQVVADNPVERKLVTLVERRREHFHRLQRKHAGLVTKLTVLCSDFQ